MDAFYQFLKTEASRRNEVSTGMVLLDQAFKIPLGSTLLVYGPPAVGTTALSLQLSAQLSNSNRLVIYFDIYNSMLNHRIGEVNDKLFVISRINGLQPSEFLELVEQTLKDQEDVILVFDSVHFYQTVWRQWSFIELVKRVKLINPDITIIATQRKQPNDFWPNTVHMSFLENKYCETEEGTVQLAGHLAKISGPMGQSIVYVNHYTGKICNIYEYAMTSILSGEKTLTSTFELDGIKVRGLWNFVHTLGRKQRKLK